MEKTKQIAKWKKPVKKRIEINSKKDRLIWQIVVYLQIKQEVRGRK